VRRLIISAGGSIGITPLGHSDEINEEEYEMNGKISGGSWKGWSA